MNTPPFHAAAEALSGGIFTALWAARPRWISGERLSRTLGVSRNTVWKHVRRLRAAGHRIESRRREGYRLLREGEAPTPERLRARLATRWVGREILFFHRTGSTNDLVLEAGRRGVPAGLVAVAESQSAGRGRLGRRWFGAPGKSLAFSVLLRPSLPPAEAPLLTLAAAVAVRRALVAQGAPARIKWPNDVRVERRKVAGILTEMQAEQDRLAYAALGVGVNVSLGSRDFPPELRGKAISLREACGRTVDRADLLAGILGELEEVLDLLGSGGNRRVLSEWEAGCEGMLEPVRVRLGDRVLEGQMAGVDSSGALLLRRDWGGMERVTAGDLELPALRKPAKPRRHGPKRRAR